MAGVHHPEPAGTRFGYLVTLDPTTGQKHPLRCQCDCGKEKITTLKDVRAYPRIWGRQPSCGCATRKQSTAKVGRIPMITPAGTRFGHLVTLEEASGTNRPVLCRCDCGVEKRVPSLAKIKDRPHIKIPASCGCMVKKTTRGRPGHHLPEYRIWKGLFTRCENPNHHSYIYWLSVL